MDKKMFVIGVLSLSAVVLFAANLLQPRVARAELVVKDNDFTAVTGRTKDGAEALYVLDNRTGKITALKYEPTQKAVRQQGVPRLIMDAFKGGR